MKRVAVRRKKKKKKRRRDKREAVNWLEMLTCDRKPVDSLWRKKLLPTCDPSMWLTHILVKWVKWKFLDFRIGQKRCSSDGRRRDVWSSVGAAASFQMPPDCSITDCITECVGGNQAGNEWFVRPERSEAYSQTLIEKKKTSPFEFLLTFSRLEQLTPVSVLPLALLITSMGAGTVPRFISGLHSRSEAN